MILLNGYPVPFSFFPDKTSQVWQIDGIEKINFASIEWKFEREDEIIRLFQLKDLLDSYKIKSSLYVCYLPYARQDKEISNDNTFALHTFSKILNQMNFNKIYIRDPHSYKSLDLIENSEGVYPSIQLKNIIKEKNITLVCYPDEGASIKYDSLWEEIHGFERVGILCAEKTRCQKTGEITGMELVSSTASIGDATILIIDDICDGGSTFIKLAEILKPYLPKEINLFVSHGIFSNGTASLREAGIKNIYQWDSNENFIRESFM